MSPAVLGLAATLRRRLAGPSDALFQTTPEMIQRLPPLAWRAIRWGIVALTAGVVALAFMRPSLALTVFWGLVIPALPILLFVAPGLWRNVCPIASLNQLPRVLGWSRGLTVPNAIQQYTPLVSMLLFLAIVPLRMVALERNGVALAVFVGAVLGLAFLGGLAFKGKSGWCSQICPMNQVERLYGQSPLRVVPNAHCHPCVGCTINCYDFNPTAAYLADVHAENPQLAFNRKLFAGAMPWLIVAFFTQPSPVEVSLPAVAALYGRILLHVGAGIGLFVTLEGLLRLSTQTLALLHAAVALPLFYAFALPRVAAQLGLHGGTAVLTAAGALGAGLVAALWLARALPREAAFIAVSDGAPSQAAGAVLRVHDELTSGKVEVRFEKVEVRFQSGVTVLAKPGESLLTIAEGNQVSIESGCRLGMCGADPVRIVQGADNLSPASAAERDTLRRLGLDAGCRLACVARAHGAVSVSTATDSVTGGAESRAGAGGGTLGDAAPPAFAVDESVRRVVVVGGGVAGVGAALEVRRLSPRAEVALIAEESYDFYNRMAISKLVSESTAIDKLYLMPRDWPVTHGVRFLRGVRVVAIDRGSRTVRTEDDVTLGYDRLILSTGASSAVPRVEGFGMTGSFVLRTIDDAVDVQQYLRRRRCRTALIIGGGLLGLEAAHSIGQLGVRVFVLDRNEWPLGRQLDRTAGLLLKQLMLDLGVEILAKTEARRVVGADRVAAVELTSGDRLEVDLCLAAAGIVPNVEVARQAGLAVERGVLVDDRMATFDPCIFAAGDVIELDGASFGLWPAGLEQGQIAAQNALGGDVRFRGTTPPAKLKVAAIDLLSIGKLAAAEAGERELVLDDPVGRTYRKLVLKEGRAAGAILIGHPELFDDAVACVAAGAELRGREAALEAGDWSVLATAPAAAPATTKATAQTTT